MDWHIYKFGHLVENTVARLKHFTRIATRYDVLKNIIKYSRLTFG